MNWLGFIRLWKYITECYVWICVVILSLSMCVFNSLLKTQIRHHIGCTLTRRELCDTFNGLSRFEPSCHYCHAILPCVTISLDNLILIKHTLWIQWNLPKATNATFVMNKLKKEQFGRRSGIWININAADGKQYSFLMLDLHTSVKTIGQTIHCSPQELETRTDEA